jgi:predicted metal-binding membrane protein
MTANANLLPPSALERVLARDRRVIAGALAVLVVLAWSYLIFLSRQMGTDAGAAAMTPMPGMPSMPGMSQTPPPSAGASGGTLALAALMWWTMMIGMMLPSAAPMILLFGNVQRRQLATEHPRLRVALFTGGYLAMWAAFSALAASAQLALAGRELLATMDLRLTARLGAVLVALAGIYQLTPIKNACLRLCRSPAEFLASHWRRTSAGAVRMGLEHGLYCVGCCWLLMGLLFVVGVMNLLWVAAIALFVLVEKLLPHGETAARVSGLGLLAFAGYLAFSA